MSALEVLHVLHPRQVSTNCLIGPRDLISIDFCGPCPVSRGGAKYILAVLDVFSKYVALYGIRMADARTTIRKIYTDYVPRCGKPMRIKTDHGTQITSEAWSDKLRDEVIQAVFSSIRHPQSNAIERVNQEIGRFFRMLISDRRT